MTGPKKDDKRIDTLTGLRGAAVLVVFIAHCANAGYLPRPLGASAGQLGVMIFFVLSGFLMGMLYLDRPPTGVAIRQYFAARLGRVLPLFYVIVVLSIVATIAGIPWPYPMPDLATIARNAFLVQGTSALWAVPVEVQFYLIFAIGWWLSYRRGTFSLAAAMSFGLVVAALSAMQILAFHAHLVPVETVFYYAPYFLTGVAISMIRAPLTIWLEPSGRARLLGWIALAGLILSIPSLRRALDASVPVWADPIAFLAIGAAFLAAMRGAGPFALLARPLPVFLGELSYSIYLTHMIFLTWAEHWIGIRGGIAGLAISVAVFLVTVGVARLSRGPEQAALARAKRAARPAKHRAGDHPQLRPSK